MSSLPKILSLKGEKKAINKEENTKLEEFQIDSSVKENNPNKDASLIKLFFSR